ncbi:hypothetical protein Syun_007377 [Stephania yunnanensis]|uniref:Uncharacterized protein n=1 Tax=Stephania yunnanensis TaxID=152371 RepID=A0AAP0Q2B7_9MAGN
MGSAELGVYWAFEKSQNSFTLLALFALVWGVLRGIDLDPDLDLKRESDGGWREMVVVKRSGEAWMVRV